MHPLIAYLLAAFAVVVFLYLFWKVIKKIIVNSLIGLFLLFLLKYAFGANIPINVWTLAVTAFFGLAGVGSLLILHVGGLLS